MFVSRKKYDALRKEHAELLSLIMKRDGTSDAMIREMALKLDNYGIAIENIRKAVVDINTSVHGANKVLADKIDNLFHSQIVEFEAVHAALYKPVIVPKKKKKKARK